MPGNLSPWRDTSDFATITITQIESCPHYKAYTSLSRQQTAYSYHVNSLTPNPQRPDDNHTQRRGQRPRPQQRGRAAACRPMTSGTSPQCSYLEFRRFQNPGAGDQGGQLSVNLAIWRSVGGAVDSLDLIARRDRGDLPLCRPADRPSRRRPSSNLYQWNHRYLWRPASCL